MAARDQQNAREGRQGAELHGTQLLIVIGSVIAIFIGLALPVLAVALHFGLGGVPGGAVPGGRMGAVRQLVAGVPVLVERGLADGRGSGSD
jgi:hypothetical protein